MWKGILGWLTSLFAAKQQPLSDIEQARRLLAALDRGGVPLNPARVNAIPHKLRQEVHRTAPGEQTTLRLRRAVERAN